METAGRTEPSRASQRRPEHVELGRMIEVEDVGEAIDRMSRDAAEILAWVLVAMRGEIGDGGDIVPLDLRGMALEWKMDPDDMLRIFEEISRYVVVSGADGQYRMRLIVPLGWSVADGERENMLTFMTPVRISHNEEGA